MLVQAEVARAAVYAAAVRSTARATTIRPGGGRGQGDGADAALFCGKTGIQVHGGMGFTWEVDAQRYWKRAVVLDTSFGSADFHADAVAATLVAGRV